MQHDHFLGFLNGFDQFFKMMVSFHNKKN